MTTWRFAGILLLASGSLLSQAQRRELLVGAAKVDITPESPLALSGYPDPETRISEGIHDRLYARAIAFKNGGKRLVLVSCDLSGFQYTPAYFYQKEIFAKFDLKPDELFLCGTHTHSGPMLFLSKTYPHPNTSTYTEGLRAKLRDAVGRALNAAAPARIAAGIGQSPIAVNRRLPLPDGQTSPSGGRVTMGRNPDGPVDREVQVLKIARRDGVPIASIFDYACHSRSLRAANKLISGDIFGIAGSLWSGPWDTISSPRHLPALPATSIPGMSFPAFRKTTARFRKRSRWGRRWEKRWSGFSGVRPSWRGMPRSGRCRSGWPFQARRQRRRSIS
jgi:hypothetical protein